MVFLRPGEGIKTTTVVNVFDIMHSVLKALYRPVQGGCSSFQHFNISSYAQIFHDNIHVICKTPFFCSKNVSD